MKYLNKNSPNCKLNIKLRKLYKEKQEINNSKLTNEEKKAKMKDIDRQILKLWRDSTVKDIIDVI